MSKNLAYKSFIKFVALLMQIYTQWRRKFGQTTIALVTLAPNAILLITEFQQFKQQFSLLNSKLECL
jgi:hypothetical protein